MTLPEVLATVEPWAPKGDWSNVISWDHCPAPTVQVIVNRDVRGYVIRRFVPSGDAEAPTKLAEERIFPSREAFASHLRDPPLPSCGGIFIALDSWGIMIDLASDGRLRSADVATFSE